MKGYPMPKATTNDQETKQPRAEALERIQRLQERVSARNRDMTAEQAEAVAEELSQDAIRSMRERGDISFERDHS
ncbi:MAG: hypothetical protein M3457_03570 [Chloroflexota bacterium]|nr:hypothetical protein [Chloroflexota bacterium]